MVNTRRVFVSPQVREEAAAIQTCEDLWRLHCQLCSQITDKCHKRAQVLAMMYKEPDQYMREEVFGTELFSLNEAIDDAIEELVAVDDELQSRQGSCQ